MCSVIQVINFLAKTNLNSPSIKPKAFLQDNLKGWAFFKASSPVITQSKKWTINQYRQLLSWVQHKFRNVLSSLLLHHEAVFHQVRKNNLKIKKKGTEQSERITAPISSNLTNKFLRKKILTFKNCLLLLELSKPFLIHFKLGHQKLKYSDLFNFNTCSFLPSANFSLKEKKLSCSNLRLQLLMSDRECARSTHFKLAR